jgi:hypothetical protein
MRLARYGAGFLTDVFLFLSVLSFRSVMCIHAALPRGAAGYCQPLVLDQTFSWLSSDLPGLLPNLP